MIKKHEIKAFTLVELIVVITILGILTAVWFVWYSGYVKWARDSNRLSQLKWINDWLEVYRVKENLPLPENSVEIRLSWSILWYQWYMWENNIDLIWYNKWWKDPKDGTYFSYYVTKDKKYFQLLWYLEEPKDENLSKNLTNTTYATDYSERYLVVYWSKLWILTEAVTNLPIQEISSISASWYIDLATNTWTYKANFTNSDSLTLTWLLLQNLQNVLKVGNWFSSPKLCPEWFLPVPWNKQFNQPWFCVAKYEMSYYDSDVPNTWTMPWWYTWNTVNYISWKVPVSIPLKYPIAWITQQQSIDACKSMWAWYHLITNNEWMTIARNLELQSKNWTWGVVWTNNIYNWVSESGSLWCWWYSNSLYTSLPRTFWTKTWWWFWNIDCDKKRELVLSNWETIWDLAWNIYENVNKANSFNWIGYDSWQTYIAWCWSSWPMEWTMCTDKANTSLNLTYNSSNWIWQLYYNPWLANNIFVRGWSARLWDWTSGIFTLLLPANTTIGSNIWFRCSY